MGGAGRGELGCAGAVEALGLMVRPAAAKLALKLSCKDRRGGVKTRGGAAADGVGPEGAPV